MLSPREKDALLRSDYKVQLRNSKLPSEKQQKSADYGSHSNAYSRGNSQGNSPGGKKIKHVDSGASSQRDLTGEGIIKGGRALTMDPTPLGESNVSVSQNLHMNLVNMNMKLPVVSSAEELERSDGADFEDYDLDKSQMQTKKKIDINGD